MTTQQAQASPPARPEITIFWEDFEIGRTVTFGRKVVTKDEIVAFARAYDPQPHHLDEEAARASMLGGLAASGWQSCGMLMRMLVDELFVKTASLGSPGIDEARWLKPVRPGDTLTGRFTVLEKRTLASRPGVGMCRTVFEMLNQTDEVVLDFDCVQFFRTREGGTAA